MKIVILSKIIKPISSVFILFLFLSIVTTAVHADSIQGIGNLNFLPKFTGSTAIGNSIVFDDGSNIGVGTTAPLNKLSVIGNAAFGSSYSGKTAPSNGIIIQGNVGVGTATPGYSLDVAGNIRSSTGILVGNGAANGPTISFYNQTNMGFYNKGSNSMGIVANGQEALLMSGNAGIGTMTIGNVVPVNEKLLITGQGSMDFIRINSAAAGEAGDIFTIKRTGGYVGIGVTAPGSRLSIAGSLSVGTTDASSFALVAAPYSGAIFEGNVGIGTTNPGQKLDISGGNGRVESGFNWLTNSDIKFKTNITTLTNALDSVMNLRGVRYDLKTDFNQIPGEGKQVGFIAQELEKQYPEMVFTEENGTKSVSYDKMTAVLVEAIKEQQRQIDLLKKEVELLKANN